MGDFAAFFLGACLVNNLILDSMLGLPPAVAVSKKISTALGMALAMTVCLPAAALITYPLFYYVLVPLGYENFKTFSLILTITLVIKLCESLIRLIRPALYEKITEFIPLVLINSSILGLVLINVQEQHGITGSLFYGLGSGAGFGLVVTAMSAMQDRMTAVEIPAPLRGIAITLITVGIMSMAFMGFNGIISLQ